MGGAIIVVICIIGAIIWGLYAGQQRHDAMGLLAETLGLSFSHERNYRIAERYAFLNTLDQGANRYAYNIITGMFAERAIALFDYHYETYSTDAKEKRQTHHHHCSFFILTLKSPFPELTIANEGVFSKMAQAVGLDEIDVNSPAFSNCYVVRSTDKKFACDFCNAPMIDYLLQHPEINIEIDQNQLVLGLNACLQIDAIETRLNQLVTIRSLMPESLFED